jgi:serine protease Do
MKKRCLFVAFAIFLGFCAPAFADKAPEELLKAVVKIRAMIPAEARTAVILGTEREGHGVLIDSKGLILTTGYIILESETIEVTGPEGKKSEAAFVGYDYATGFGILRTDEPLNVEPIKLGRSSTVKVGDPVMVAGYGGAASAMGARVVARREFTGYWEYLLDNAIYTSLFTQLAIQGLGSLPCNVFIPIDLLPPILEDLIAVGHPRKPARPWLGINAEEAHGRVFITRSSSGGPAERAGLRPGDLILKVNGKAVEGLSDFYRKVWALGSSGVKVTLTILSGTEIRDLILATSDRSKFFQLKPKKTI